MTHGVRACIRSTQGYSMLLTLCMGGHLWPLIPIACRCLLKRLLIYFKLAKMADVQISHSTTAINQVTALLETNR